MIKLCDSYNPPQAQHCVYKKKLILSSTNLWYYYIPTEYIDNIINCFKTYYEFKNCNWPERT